MICARSIQCFIPTIDNPHANPPVCANEPKTRNLFDFRNYGKWRHFAASPLALLRTDSTRSVRFRDPHFAQSRKLLTRTLFHNRIFWPRGRKKAPRRQQHKPLTATPLQYEEVGRYLRRRPDTSASP